MTLKRMMLVMLLAPLCFAAAPAGQYVVSTETVRDTKTTLTWQKVASAPMAWSAALAYCSALNLGGMATGWRLPNIKELGTIVDESAPTGTELLDPAYPITGITKFMWSSTPTQNFSWGRAYTLYTLTGEVMLGVDATSYPVRCIHP